MPGLVPDQTDTGNRDTPRHVERIPRREFVREFGREYRPGQHKSSFGPTQRGKTRLDRDLLRQIISPDHPAVLLAGKPPGRDPGMETAAKELKLREIEKWDDASPGWDKRRGRNGYVLRPRHTMTNPDEDDANLRREFRKAMLATYASKTPVITVIDETHHVQNDLRLKREAEQPLMRGAPVNAAWNNAQRGAYISYHCYGAPEHLFLFYDPVTENQKRYRDIGGVDPDLLVYLTQNLELRTTKTGGTVSEAVYIRRAGPQIMIVGID